MRVLDLGAVNPTNALRCYPGAAVTSVDIRTGWDLMRRGVPDGNWDVIFASHIIEHVTNPDYLLQECVRVMRTCGARLHVKTPNLAAWFNRLALCLGYVPFDCEVSTVVNLGKLGGPRADPPGGHLRLFTVAALRTLCVHWGLIVDRIEGVPRGFPDFQTFPAPLRTLDKGLAWFPTWAAELSLHAHV